MLVFTPSVSDIYPPGFDSEVHVGGPAVHSIEAKCRPGHFVGVATVVLKLLNIVRPERLYLGQKDAVQVAVLQKLVRDMAVQTEVRVVPTHREADGLAMSSRNTYLSPAERAIAPALYRSLGAAVELCRKGQRDRERLLAAVSASLAGTPQIETQYVSLMDARTGLEVQEAAPGSVLSYAGRLGTTRLIDAVVL